MDGTTSKAEKDNDWCLVPLPERADRDQAFAVDIVSTRKTAGDVKSRWFPGEVALQAPKTDLPNTFAEWQLFAPEICHLSSFGGTMTAVRGTTYSLHDALSSFTGFYARTLGRTHRRRGLDGHHRSSDHSGGDRGESRRLAPAG